MQFTFNAFSAFTSIAISSLIALPNASSQSLQTAHLLNLAPNPSFEDRAQNTNGWSPIGIVVDGIEPLSVADTISHTGNCCMRIDVGPTGETKGTLYYSSFNAGEGDREAGGRDGVRGVRTIAYRLDRDVGSMRASVWVKMEAEQNICLKAVWYARNGRKRPVELTHTDISTHIIDNEDGWLRFEIDVPRPHNSHQVELWIETTGKSPFYVDDVHIVMLRSENIQILVNQLGYEPDSQSKGILLQSSVRLEKLAPTFAIVDLKSLNVVLNGEWAELGYHESFDRYYWRGDIGTLDKQGTYIVEARHGSDLIASVPFDIRENLTDQATRLTYEFFYYQRCGMEVPGFHKACHLDDAIMSDGTHLDLVGGWHDAGDYNKYNIGYTPESLYALALTYGRRKEFFGQFDRDDDGICDILDEALWGAKYLYKCLDLETYKVIGNVSSGYRYWGTPEAENQRPVTGGYVTPGFLVGGFALVGKYANNEHYVTLAEELYQHNGGNIRDLVALYQATENEEYLAQLQERIQQAISSEDRGLSQFKELAEYAIDFPSAGEIDAIKKLAPKKHNEIQLACDEYFSIRQYGSSDGKYYFRAYNHINDWYVGDCREILNHAYMALLVEKMGNDSAREVAENQLHWIFGRNPFDTSLMEGAGKRFIPCYHHRYNVIPGNPRGAVPGAVVNGITRSWPWTDRPWLDLNPVPNGDFQPNEPWLPHNINMLYVMSLWD